jgi:hypothetical protein
VRIWSLHPRYLDRQGLTACWREGLLAQAVLAGRTRGYRQHSQLERFRAQPDPVAAVGAYLEAVAREAADRGYRFDVTRIDRTGPPAGTAPAGAAVARIPVTEGQVAHEWAHLAAKLAARSGRRPKPASPTRTSIRYSRSCPARRRHGSGAHSPQRRPDEQLGDEEAGNEVEATGTGPSPRASSHRSSGSDRNGAMLPPRRAPRAARRARRATRRRA